MPTMETSEPWYPIPPDEPYPRDDADELEDDDLEPDVAAE